MRRDEALTSVWENADFVLSRGVVVGRDQPVWSVTCGPAASPDAWPRVEREFALRDVFDPSWAVQPLAIEEHLGRKRLLLADAGGELMASCLARAHALPERLGIALGAACSVRQLHERELIHRDIHPASLVVDVATGRVWLRGTGLCSRLRRGRYDDARASARSGTLQYMSPEQTGRINRSVDARSDLYALGITLYELFAGRHPFSAREPLEWMHCHVARQPAPLHQVAADVPVGLSAVVHKLIAKTPEDRYQTAAGLEADLRACVLVLAQTGEIASFALGSHDVSAELRIPERLYGRSKHLDALHAALASVTASGRMQIVSIAGGSGVGKSSLVNELQTAILTAGGHFAAGKVDQLKRDIPYASVAEAGRALVRMALSRRDDEIADARSALREALGPHGRLLVNVIPELAHLVDAQPLPPELSPEEAKSRFHALFRRFLGVFARPGHPLTLFLDDLQWLDTASLELLHALIAGNVEHVLLVCAYREHEVRPPHPFLATLSLLRKGPHRLDELHVDALSVDDVTQLLVDSLRVPSADAAPLARAVHEKTAGNPFFVVQFVTNLVQEGLVAFAQGVGWTWRLARIEAREATDNVVALMVGTFDSLPARTRLVLAQLACLGRRATTARLAAASGLSVAEVDDALLEVARSRLVIPTDAGYAFSHDRVQEASYALIPEPERAAMHLKLGRLLASAQRGADANEELFEVVHQFDRGASLIASSAEREQVARLYLDAGQRGKQAMAHASARGYFLRGRALLGDDAADAHYALCRELELGAAEAMFLAGEPSQAAEVLAALAQRVRTHRDRATVTRLRILVHSALDQQVEAVAVCLAFLRQTGIDWEPHPSRARVLSEYGKIVRQLEGRTVESLIDLPPMVDEDRRATLDTLTAVLPVAIFLDENLNCLLICTMVNMSLAHGNSAGSCFAYVQLGRVLGHYFGDPLAGFRFGRLAYDLLARPGMAAHGARVASVFSICIHPWTNHVASSVPLARRAFDIARETGDLTFATYTCVCLITILLASGRPLADVETEANAALAFARAAKFGQFADIVTTQIRLIRALRGLAPGTVAFDDGGVDEHAFEQHLASNPGLSLGACWYWIRKLQGRYLEGDFHAAREAGDRAGALLWVSGAFLDEAEYDYFKALTLAALFDTEAEEARHALVTGVEGHLRRLEAWAKHCPSNFDDKVALVAAEYARLRGDEREAMRLYERAVSTARANDFVHDEAIAHEVAGRFYDRLGLHTSAHAHRMAARSAYRRWGATAKQRQLDALIAARDPLPEQVVPVRLSAEDVDLATVVKTSQAVSHQVGHARVVRSLMEVAVEHAGAQRGLLLLKAGEDLQIEAEATTHDAVEVEVFSSTPDRALPESLVRYVARTRETVLLDDGMTLHQFAADAYFASCSPRSVLCLPIEKQTQLTGILYLENNLAPNVFTYTRVEVLKLLASQAAISLENASLEEKDALLKEVHHRVKNNLQLISSMLNLQAARVGDARVAELFADCRHRVRSMALVHENLYRAGNFSHIPMREHVRTLCEGISRAYDAGSRGIAIDVAVDDVHLAMGRAITCGLVINELVANALKHAFPNGRTGAVRVALVAAAQGACTLSVTDDGVGLDAGFDVAQADSLGLQLVQDFVQQLGGEMQTHGGAGGTRFAIMFSATGQKERARPERGTSSPV
ncbi:MAG: AAA family ATPase [Polyangiales bacterium]